MRLVHFLPTAPPTGKSLGLGSVPHGRGIPRAHLVAAVGQHVRRLIRPRGKEWTPVVLPGIVPAVSPPERPLCIMRSRRGGEGWAIPRPAQDAGVEDIRVVGGGRPGVGGHSATCLAPRPVRW